MNKHILLGLILFLATLVNAQDQQVPQSIRPHWLNDSVITLEKGMIILTTKLDILAFTDSLISEVQSHNPTSELWSLQRKEESIEQIVDSSRTMFTIWAFNYKLTPEQANFAWLGEFLGGRDPHETSNPQIEAIYWIMDHHANSIVLAIRHGSETPPIIKNTGNNKKNFQQTIKRANLICSFFKIIGLDFIGSIPSGWR